jgi:hypothetical protein
LVDHVASLWPVFVLQALEGSINLKTIPDVHAFHTLGLGHDTLFDEVEKLSFAHADIRGGAGRSKSSRGIVQTVLKLVRRGHSEALIK